jgi:hypothetical protein
MKDYTEEDWRGGRPDISALDAVSICLEQLFANNKKKGSEEVVPGLTYAELIGALLLAEDVIVEHEDCYG